MCLSSSFTGFSVSEINSVVFRIETQVKLAGSPRGGAHAQTVRLTRADVCLNLAVCESLF